MNHEKLNAPIIGITMCDVSEEGNYRLPAYYINAVRMAGGIPLGIAPNETNYEALLASIDGCILSGGGDINPNRYGGCAHEAIYGVNDTRDESEFTLAKLLLDNQIPTLGICRGLQVINCVLGGTLIQHIPDLETKCTDDNESSNRMSDHRNKDATLTKRTVVHDVTLTASSRLAKIYDSINFPVMSWHHQSIDEMPEGFQAVAVCHDGIIESMESAAYPNLIVVQWHPEMPLQKDDIHPRLFKHFIKMAIEQRELRFE